MQLPIPVNGTYQRGVGERQRAWGGSLARERTESTEWGPERANQVARTIPTGRIPWEFAVPGHFEVGTAHHSGAPTMDEYVHTIQLVDVAMGWSGWVAVLGRSQRQMEAGFRRLQARLPFPIRELHPDNGSEFLNDHLARYWSAITRLDTWAHCVALNALYEQMWRYYNLLQSVVLHPAQQAQLTHLQQQTTPALYGVPSMPSGITS